MRDKNGTTSFLPKKKKGGKVRFCEEVTYIPNREKMCLTKDQATQIYKEIKNDDQSNIQIASQGAKDESKVRKKQVKEEDTDINVNPYQKAISNANSRDENKIKQTINWSVFSNKIRYVDSCMNVTPLEEKKCRKLFSTLKIKKIRYQIWYLKKLK